MTENTRKIVLFRFLLLILRFVRVNEILLKFPTPSYQLFE